MKRAFDMERFQRRFAENLAATQALAARAPKPEAGNSLTDPRPKVAESEPRVAPMESEHMRNIDTASGAEILTFPTMPMAPSPRVIAALALQRGLNALAPAGSRRCRKLARRIDLTLAESEAHSDGLARRADNEARAMLRIRCGTCPERCKDPLL